MERNLKFLKTMSVAEFKAQHNVEKIEVKRNEHTGKCFFVYGFETGACSRKVESGELTIPVISEVCSAETGDIFLLLHQKGEGGATTLVTLYELMKMLQKGSWINSLTAFFIFLSS